jgi:hypothetical protein
MRWLTARQLEDWARGIGSRVELAKLVSDLIRASSTDITVMPFPSGDKGQVRGFDGHLQSEIAAMNVPRGRSFWEFGTNNDYKAKALNDFKSRSAEMSDADQHETTFIFVSPWTWDSSDPKNKIEDWIAERKGESNWKDVCYVDGSMLESWLESCPAVAAWHARNTLKTYPVADVRSTDEFWQDYSGNFGPPITEDVLLCERADIADRLVNALCGPPCALSYVADSPDEVVAFAVAAIRRAKPEVRLFLEARTLVIDSIAAGRQLIGNEALILFLRNDASRSPGQFASMGSTLVPLGGQQRGGTAQVLARPTGYAMGLAMKSMGFSESEALTLARGCGRSLTALARLKPGGSFELPTWLSKGSELLPAILAGAWDATNELDRAVIEKLVGPKSYSQLETTMRSFLKDADPPFDLEGTVWKVRAPMDAFVRVGHLLSSAEAGLLKAAMLEVFSRPEPVTNPEDAFRITRGSTSGYSEWIREGLATTLLLLAVWAEPAEVNLGTESGQAFANGLIENLPGLGTDHRLLSSLHLELPLLAEAAPNPLLSALERMLEGTGDLIRTIFEEKEGFIVPIARHTGILFALECLAWDPEYFRRAVLILARLAQIDPGGRIGNRPFNSLNEIFVLWNPNTNASSPQRMSALDEIIRTTPDVGWRLTRSLLPSTYGTSSPTCKPRLREAYTIDRAAITYSELWETQTAVVQRAIAGASHSDKRWTQLIRAWSNFPKAEREVSVVALDITLEKLDTEPRKRLWLKISEEVSRHERFGKTDWALPAEELSSLKTLLEKYLPEDRITPVLRIFDEWTLDDAGDLEAANLQRAVALKELCETGGAEAVVGLGMETKLPYLVLEAIGAAELEDTIIEQIFELSFARDKISILTIGLAGLYRNRFGRKRAEARLVRAIEEGGTSKDIVGRIIMGWPDDEDTWASARKLGSAVVSSYWTQKPARYLNVSRVGLFRSALMLLRFGRPSAALQSSFNRLSELPTKFLFKLVKIPRQSRGP